MYGNLPVYPLNWWSPFLIHFSLDYVNHPTTWQVTCIKQYDCIALKKIQRDKSKTVPWKVSEKNWDIIESKLRWNWDKTEMIPRRNWDEIDSKLNRNWVKSEPKLSQNWANTESHSELSQNRLKTELTLSQVSHIKAKWLHWKKIQRDTNVKLRHELLKKRRSTALVVCGATYYSALRLASR